MLRKRYCPGDTAHGPLGTSNIGEARVGCLLPFAASKVGVCEANDCAACMSAKPLLSRDADLAQHEP